MEGRKAQISLTMSGRNNANTILFLYPLELSTYVIASPANRAALLGSKVLAYALLKLNVYI